jgi:hypothetical protein
MRGLGSGRVGVWECVRMCPVMPYGGPRADNRQGTDLALGERVDRAPELHCVSVLRGYFTFTAVQAAPTVLYSVLSAPYRSFAALSVAVRAFA